LITTIKALFEAARPRQWVKNLAVAVPLVFAKRLTEPGNVKRALAATAIFCAVSSAVYLWNDVVDLEKDRAHPVKCKRPIASGRLSVTAAKAAAATLAAGGLALGLLLGWFYAFAAWLYLAQNLAYSHYLKRVVYVDVLSIASGFLLRVIAGALAIGVETSPYLLVCTGLVACYFGFGKRAHELAAAGEDAGATRAVLRSYRMSALRVALWVTGGASLIAYVLYTRAPHTLEFFGTTRMVWTAPCAAYGLLRFYALVTREGVDDSPTDMMLKDAPFVLNFLLWAAAVTLIIYFRP
jgi:4-hydroxybenzoate polyprenyltransferase